MKFLRNVNFYSNKFTKIPKCVGSPKTALQRRKTANIQDSVCFGPSKAKAQELNFINEKMERVVSILATESKEGPPENIRTFRI